MSSKTLLMVIGVVMLIKGVLVLAGWWPTGLGDVIVPTWHLWVEVVVGVIAIWTASADGQAAPQA